MGTKPTKCPNCEGKEFGALQKDGGTKYGAIVSAEETNNGFVLNTENILVITPIICSDCGYVMLFR